MNNAEKDYINSKGSSRKARENVRYRFVSILITQLWSFISRKQIQTSCRLYMIKIEYRFKEWFIH